MAQIRQTKPEGRTGRRFLVKEAFRFERDGIVVAEYVPGLMYFETEANKGAVKQNEGRIDWL